MRKVVENKAFILVYVWYFYQDGLLCASFLPTETTGEEIFEASNDYMFCKLSWTHFVSVRSDNRLPAIY